MRNKLIEKLEKLKPNVAEDFNITHLLCLTLIVNYNSTT